MKFHLQWMLGLLCFVSFGWHSEVQADPCGMVPPPYRGPGVALKRVGPQKTYVFYKNGVESIVLRPAFSGKVDNFGMLIPFPKPPTIRKLPDNIFAHIAAAIDPPEIPVYLWRRRRYRKYKAMMAPSIAVAEKSAPRRKRVRVLRKEAVGMYQVAVLEAGSSAALKRWMDRNGYKYPKGMDKPVEDYVKLGWCFVAVKTRVSGKKGVSPRPGMRRARPSFPRGGSFNGAVQAMGFRFRTPKLIVPMRLSAFNAGRLRNVVYILTNGPRQIRNIPKSHVVRQVSGQTLYRNITELLPIRVYGGKPYQIPRYRWGRIQNQRNPKRHNGLARDLFASDLRAVQLRKLSLRHETRKKQLLNIGEVLKLRGRWIDQLNRQAIQQERAYTVQESLLALRGMTMTIVDGDFPRKVLARENLTFPRYRMPAPKKSRSRRRRCHYNARFLRRYCRSGGILTRWQGPMYARPPAPRLVPKPVYKQRRIPRNARKIYRWIAMLDHPKKSAKALQYLLKLNQKAIPYLTGEFLEGSDLVRRGWSLVALTKLVHGSKFKKQLMDITKKPKEPKIVKTWALAARIQQEKTLRDLQLYTRYHYTYRAIQRPMRLKITAILRKNSKVSIRNIFLLSQRFTFLRQMLMPLAEKAGVAKLVTMMATDKSNSIRRMAASYVAGLARKKPRQAAKAILHAYRFRPSARKVPWHGGALFVPGMYWNRGEARQLVRQLLTWYIWCHRNNLKKQFRQIHNNIRSLQLARAAGYRSPGWRKVDLRTWIRLWRSATSCREVKSMFRIQKAERKYARLLQQVGCR